MIDWWWAQYLSHLMLVQTDCDKWVRFEKAYSINKSSKQLWILNAITLMIDKLYCRKHKLFLFYIKMKAHESAYVQYAGWNK